MKLNEATAYSCRSEVGYNPIKEKLEFICGVKTSDVPA
jgi:hypothetical protein